MLDLAPFSPLLLQKALLYSIFSAIGAFIWAPLLTSFLYKYKITRRGEYDITLQEGERTSKIGTPIMGGLLVIITVTIVTLLFNWNRENTYVPIAVMGLSALLGGVDDPLNIFGKSRRERKISHVINLIKVHKKWYMRLFYIFTLPWTIYCRAVSAYGSNPGKGIRVHEKLIFQFLAGAVTAWWIYYKLGTHWHSLWIPFGGQLAIGWWIIPVVIFAVMFTANAVNISDGLDGLAGFSLLSTFGGLTIISWAQGRASFALLNATVLGALVAYTYFNIKPARFQMGDVGTLGLGALFAINTIAINRTVLLPILGFIFFVEIFSVIFQVLYRQIAGRRLFKMAPIHYHFQFLGWSEEKIVMRFALIHFFVVIVGVWIALS